MGKENFGARAFQKCTINKVVKELYGNSKRKPKRFLVADEVGLGKTIVAKHVIDHLRDSKSGRKVIIYVSSSLDITKQNKYKLSRDVTAEIVSADRVNLIYQNGPLKSGVQIITMTPGTSLSMQNSQGNADERRYMAYLIHMHLGYGFLRLSRVFAGACTEENFFNSLKRFTNDHKNKRSFEGLESRIIHAWTGLRLGSGESMEDILKNPVHYKDSRKDLIIKMRMVMAKCVLESLQPDLIIFDEFQKFRELTSLKSNEDTIEHELAQILLKDEVPTLLLSATPYKLFSTAKSALGNTDNDGSHLKDLENTFSFLTGSKSKGNELVKEIRSYGNKIQNLEKENLSTVLNLKARIESDVMKYMSRTERINFGNPELSIQPKFLSESKDYDCNLTKDNFLEFLRMSKYVSSQQQLLTFWKSGSSFMTHLQKYELVKEAVSRSKSDPQSLEDHKDLYSKLRESSGEHVKLKYIYKDVCGSGKAFNYLWIPPTKQYYEGKGIFSSKELELNQPKKGLVFSSWIFVPKLIATEISGRKLAMSSNAKKGKYKIQPSAEGLAKLFFPSTFLSQLLTQSDFLEAGSYDSLRKVVRQSIKSKLTAAGFRFDTGVRGYSESAIMSYMEFHKDEMKWEKYKKVLKGKSHLMGVVDDDHYADYSKIQFDPKEDNLVTDSGTIDSLCEIAISSPSICLLRGIEEIKSNNLKLDEWLDVSSFCLKHLRQYISRESHLKVFVKNGRGSKPIDKVLDYFKNGNIQALWDEYLYLTYADRTGEKGVLNLLVKLSHIFASTRNKTSVKTSQYGEEKQISLDFAVPFGEGSEVSKSRDTIRDAFNSPFWPFVLATTSMGQEGLDFHLYCNDIYHWNLPSNPVDFEQREGRLNRFNNYAVRKNVMNNASDRLKDIPNESNLWDFCFDVAKSKAHRTDRYSLGMSPNWIYTPFDKKAEIITRHVLDIPFSNDRKRYERLMDDLSMYRLALGQPDQQDFLKRLHEKDIFNEIDIRSVTLDFFPSSERDHKNEIQNYLSHRTQLEQLMDDCLDHVKEIKSDKKADLEFEIHRHVARIKAYHRHEKVNRREYHASVEALYYFMDPFDQISDRDPIRGYVDDLKKLKAA